MIPGTPEAKAQGCTCDVTYYEDDDVWVIPNCPIHNTSEIKYKLEESAAFHRPLKNHTKMC